jgi:hypothetical protein
MIDYVLSALMQNSSDEISEQDVTMYHIFTLILKLKIKNSMESIRFKLTKDFGLDSKVADYLLGAVGKLPSPEKDRNLINSLDPGDFERTLDLLVPICAESMVDVPTCLTLQSKHNVDVRARADPNRFGCGSDCRALPV